MIKSPSSQKVGGVDSTTVSTHVRVPSPLSTAFSSGSHDMVLGVGSPGVGQVRVLPFTDGSSPALHDMVLCPGWPGVVQVGILSDTDGFSLAPHDSVRD